MKGFKLTVFTEPVSDEGPMKRIRSLVRPLKRLVIGKAAEKPKKYGGHYAVTRSLLMGLERTDALFNYNPSLNNVYENVVVLAGVERLKEVVGLKKNGKIAVLAAGPNVVDDVLAEEELLTDPAIDIYITPSEWVKRLVLGDCKKLNDRVYCWPAGVDSEYWQPVKRDDESKNVLIYWKTEPEEFYRQVVDVVKKNGWRPLTIRNGKYKPDEYKQALERSRFAIFISRSESQGIALSEAWSMNVPTIAFDPGSFSFHGREVYDISSCPYLTTATGAKWHSIDHLQEVLDDKNSFKNFSPRSYVLDHFTDEHSAKQLIHIISSVRRPNPGFS